MDYTTVCLPCRLARHEECSVALAGDLEEGMSCCCGGSYDKLAHLKSIFAEQFMDGEPAPKRGKKADVIFTGAPELDRGNSGYIHPQAWPSPRDIGTLADAASTGRKRVAEMYPITPGQVCDWARQKNCGGGPKPILGCMGNPASDLHHGPDKNTLNNEKGSRGVGVHENVHVICSDCHNLWHSLNDPLYPPYDRQEDQARPWLPVTDEPWGPHGQGERGSFI